MNLEYLIIGILFLAALIYLWQKIVIPFNKKGDGCASGCCSVDLDQLENKRKK